MKNFTLKPPTPPNLKINYRQKLNPDQLKVVTQAVGPCLVLAGAGSGKTRTIVYRVTYLLEHGVDPENILLLTFTNKAAREMLDRVSQLLKNKLPHRLWGGTFHSTANRLLRVYGKLIGYPNNFTIFDEEDSRSLIKVCLKDKEADKLKKLFPSAAVLKELISLRKNTLQPLAKVIDLKHPKWLKLTKKIEEMADYYEQKKFKNKAMDFDDLLTNWLKLLTDQPRISDKLARQFKYILVDEYQDTNRLQTEIIKRLSSYHQNILVVGDDAQSIYSFRGAEIDNIMRFPKEYRQTKTFKLETNYRSTPEILDLANSVIAQNKYQFPKNLKAVKSSLGKPSLIPALTSIQEADFVCQQIIQLHNEGLKLNEIAVLFRASFHSQAVEMELTKNNVPYEYRGGVKFFERAHVKDTLAFIKVYNNSSDQISWLRILNMMPGIGSITASRIHDQLKGCQTVAECLSLPIEKKLTEKAKTGWQALTKILINQLKLNQEKIIATDIIKRLIESDYQNYLEAAYPNWRERLDDLRQLAVFAGQYKTLNAFLTEIALQEQFVLSQGKKDRNQDKLILSTIHQAKGLEWPAVFIINLIDSALPHYRALEEPKGLEEERRLFYVAITRAKKQLFLSYGQTSNIRSLTVNTPSPFLEEISAGLLEKVELIKADLPASDGDVQYLPDLDAL